MEKTEIYRTTTSGKLYVKDNLKFLELLSGADKDVYTKLKLYGRKILTNKAQDLPFGDQDMIINWAIVKLMQGFDNEAGANLLTYFNSKLQGEISDFRNKRDSLTRKVHKMINEANEVEGYVYSFNSDTQSNEIDKVTEETPETIMISEDVYYRKLQAFRMAFSGIPKYSQYILNAVVESPLTLEELSEQENISAIELTKIRNYALSLILSRVLRSNHLTDEEKQEIKDEHGLM
jgi:hypothetical protein